MKRIYLRTVGFGATDIRDLLIPRVRTAFGIEVGTLPSLKDPAHAYNAERRQYLSSAMFPLLEKDLPHDALRVLGITTVDLYVPQLNFVFGEAKLGGPSAVISACRLRPEFYGQPPDERLLLRRAEIEAVHELGHTFGLMHCPKSYCVMHFSNSIIETDRKGPKFCKDCLMVAADVVKRQTTGSNTSGGLSQL